MGLVGNKRVLREKAGTAAFASVAAVKPLDSLASPSDSSLDGAATDFAGVSVPDGPPEAG